MGVPACPLCGAPNLPGHRCVAQAAQPLPPESGLSFSERFRGTQWDTAAQSPGPAGQQQGRYARQVSAEIDAQFERRGPSPLLIIGVVFIVTALVGVGVFVFTRPPPIAPPAVERAPQRTPYQPPTRPPPTTAPGPTFPVGLQTQAPGSTPGLPLGPLPDNPAGAFAALMMRGDASYVAEAEGELAFGNERGILTINVKVNGADHAITWKFTQGRERLVVSSIAKDGKYYVKPIGEPWRLAPSLDGVPDDPFTWIQPEYWRSVDYLGKADVDGRSLHHLSMPHIDWSSLPETFFLDADGGGVVIHDTSFEVWVTRSGVPRVAEMLIEATGRDAGMEVDVTLALAYNFSRFGDEIVIEAPEVVDDEGPIPG